MRTATEQAVSTATIDLMRGVVYRETDEDSWLTLQRHGAAVRDHFAAIGVDVIIDDTEGYAFLRSESVDDEAEQLPRLVKRRSLTFNVSLLLVLLRKRLVEFETSGHEGKLVLSRDQLVEILRVFLGDSTNEARVIEKIDTTIKQVAELGFIRQLRGQPNHWEVRRILKAYVDAATMADFAGKLSEYADSLNSGGGDD
ncbi:DUF4194 domain-containing protein [Microlunatus elymi]|uniref:DUF4194 domain-containing protein n=1 Tax=Microlunatus elymi TaxID=2596828 RepID=A0A516PUR8_9ACTN|nr:DUF4194 domain-containing protein [Microlunatus elymi]QDP94870.1 DUF4194 domain-containing protein [Microlunatus elymi]